jgi:Chaperone of endosialidase
MLQRAPFDHRWITAATGTLEFGRTYRVATAGLTLTFPTPVDGQSLILMPIGATWQTLNPTLVSPSGWTISGSLGVSSGPLYCHANAATSEITVTAITTATTAQVQAGTVTGAMLTPKNLADGSAAGLNFPVVYSTTGTPVSITSTDATGTALLVNANGSGASNGIQSDVNSSGNGSAINGRVLGTGNGQAVAGTVIGAGNGNGGFFRVNGNGIGNAVLAQINGTGSGHGVFASITGLGTGHAISASIASAANGDGVSTQISGSGSGNALRGTVSGSGSGSAVFATVSGSGNGSAIIAAVGSIAGATGTGQAITATAYDAPGTGSHLYAIYCQQDNASNWALYCSGKAFSTVSFTTSDRRLKSDFRPIDRAESKALLNLDLQTFVKHQHGPTHDRSSTENVARLEAEIATRKALKDKTPEDLKFIADNQAYCDKWHAEDWLPDAAGSHPGRLAGVIAQDVEAINAAYVEKLPNGMLALNDVSVLYQMVFELREQVKELTALVQR